MIKFVKTFISLAVFAIVFMGIHFSLLLIWFICGLHWNIATHISLIMFSVLFELLFFRLVNKYF